MNDGIVRFKDDAGTEVQVTPQDVRDLLCPSATEQELSLFLELCRTQRLNPFTHEAYLVKYGNGPAQMITSYHMLNARACKNQNYNGIRSGAVVLRDGKVERKRGSAVYPQAGEQLVGAWAEVMFKDGREPSYVEVARADYDTGKSNWRTRPSFMLEKCAKACAWRQAFPAELNGMYISDEMGQVEPVQAAPVQARAVHVEDAPQQAAPTDRLAPLRSRIGAYATALYPDMDSWSARAEATSNLCAFAGVGRMQDLSDGQIADLADLMDATTGADGSGPVEAPFEEDVTE